jgi:hypothetical protein
MTKFQTANRQNDLETVIASAGEAIHGHIRKEDGSLRRFAPRDDG